MSTEQGGRSAAESEAPRLIPIPDVACVGCGAGLAWRTGVGRYVISHNNGDDVCSRAVARLAQEDREAANRAYRKADEDFARARATSPEGTDR